MTKTADVSAAKLWTVLAKCHRAMSLVIEQDIVGLGLCLTDFMVLEALLHKGPLSITAIQGKVLLASGSMTAAVDRVEKKGWVVRTFTAEDRRARVLELTPQGRRLIEKVYAGHEQHLEEMMSALDSKERNQLYGALKKLGRAMSGGKHDEQRDSGNTSHHGDRE